MLTKNAHEPACWKWWRFQGCEIWYSVTQEKGEPLLWQMIEHTDGTFEVSPIDTEFYQRDQDTYIPLDQINKHFGTEFRSMGEPTWEEHQEEREQAFKKMRLERKRAIDVQERAQAGLKGIAHKRLREFEQFVVDAVENRMADEYDSGECSQEFLQDAMTTWLATRVEEKEPIGDRLARGDLRRRISEFEGFAFRNRKDFTGDGGDLLENAMTAWLAQEDEAAEKEAPYCYLCCGTEFDAEGNCPNEKCRREWAGTPSPDPDCA